MRTVAVVAIALLLVSSASAQELYNPDYSIYMALQYLGEVYAPQSVVDQISSDRMLIETAYPEVSQLAGFQEWVPGYFIVGFTDEGWLEWVGGGLQEVRDLAAEYQCFAYDSNYTLKLANFMGFEPFHSALLASLFEGLEGVRYSGPSCVGVDGSMIEVIELGGESRYLYRMAWGDCMMGCYAEHFWEFVVSGEDVTKVGEWGAVSTDQHTLGSVKALFR